MEFLTYTGQTPGVGRVTVRFDDDAGQMVGGSVAAGTFRPVGELGAFNGGDMFGDYVLSIADASTEDPLAFFSARLDIVSATDVPEPGGLALLGLGCCCCGSGGRRRWWRFSLRRGLAVSRLRSFQYGYRRAPV